ncbi:CGNR zinc finger domain-containing protein [Streptomyces sp. NBC_01186]|uniref:CGNR zinc finger domain-containing protein n=1 Tax=Streptomyces sp. NBC_01186 TaxID=2903765 RepID=UPI002E14A16B|nr:CGNR zinc finger domain-containing protein [Streptomyces sp. NBC_01186]
MQILFSDYVRGAGATTDLVNTSPLVRSAGEALPGTGALARFFAEHGMDVPAPTADDLAAVHALRGELRALLDGAEQHAPSENALPEGALSEGALSEGANALLARVAVVPVLRRDGEERWQWYLDTAPDTTPADQLAALAATGILGTLRTLGQGRFRPCAAPDCAGTFIDTSRAGRRRYCMPDLCGNRQNVANHRARRGS